MSRVQRYIKKWLTDKIIIICSIAYYVCIVKHYTHYISLTAWPV